MTQGKCCPAKVLVNPQTPDHFNCSICYQVMTQPVKLNCKAGHVFGKACISEWAITRQNMNCPFCRNNISDLAVDQTLKKQIESLQIKCEFCDQKNTVKVYSKHKQFCEKKESFYTVELQKIVKELKQLLSTHIQGHYSTKHAKQFEQFMSGEENNKDLYTNGRDWNWWWGVDPDWNSGCEECAKFWSQLGESVHYIDSKRIKLIDFINEQFAIEHIRQILEN